LAGGLGAPTATLSLPQFQQGLQGANRPGLGRGASRDRRTRVRAAVYRALLDLRAAEERGGFLGGALPEWQVLAVVSLLPPPQVRLAVRALADLVPLRDPGRPQRTRVAGAPDGPGTAEVRAEREQVSL